MDQIGDERVELAEAVRDAGEKLDNATVALVLVKEVQLFRPILCNRQSWLPRRLCAVSPCRVKWIAHASSEVSLDLVVDGGLGFCHMGIFGFQNCFRELVFGDSKDLYPCEISLPRTSRRHPPFLHLHSNRPTANEPVPLQRS
jgi:hypothetical protein